MDFDGVIERQTALLVRVVAALIAMAGLSPAGNPADVPAGVLTVGAGSSVETNATGQPAARPTMTRRLRNAVLRLLRPAESVARRIVFAAARNIKMTLPPARPKPLSPQEIIAQRHALGLPVSLSQKARARLAEIASKKAAQAVARKRQPLRYLLPLVERLPPLMPRRKLTPAHRAPRIMFFGGGAPPPFRLPPPPQSQRPDDLVSAERIGQRLATLQKFGGELDRHVRRLARWTARKDAGLIKRWSPLRPGPAPGTLARHAPRHHEHEVHELLHEAQWLAHEAAKPPDTS